MPRRARARAARRPRKKVARRGGRRTTVNINRALTPFAQRYITKMKYSETFILQLGNSYTQVLNLNSLFDPNRTGIGHQPYGFDQLAAIYNRYRVISTNYVVNGYSGGSPIRYGLLPCNEVPLINNVSELAENPRGQTRVQFPGGSTTVIKGKVYIPSLVGRTKAQYLADDRYQSLTTGSPAELALLYITGANMSDNSTDVLITVTLEFLVEFFDANNLDGS